MKQSIKFEMSLPDSSFSLYLRQLHEESNRLVVILEVVESDVGFSFSMVQDMFLNLIIYTKCNHELPVICFVIQDTEPNYWLEKVNHVRSNKEIILSADAICIYNGELKVPKQFMMVPKYYEIHNGQAIETTINSPQETKVSNTGMFSSSKNDTDDTKNGKDDTVEADKSYFSQCTII
ncbi:hypothetical protein [Legionella sainthelensi]|uniref:Uncharacterized protein n=1 Tax=Legionella sainthelensi TaxID=28087 RepID=A0A2H5FMM1_9GAMM|nr:hypothetical protein [Legionella sainthelensi]AUH72801.1 hypothetical protein CAB17_12680 [Legionella sainthelensi]